MRSRIDTGSTLPAAIAATTLAAARRVIAQDLQPGRMVVVLSGRPADNDAAFAQCRGGWPELPAPQADAAGR
jgi:hypothetical protein